MIVVDASVVVRILANEPGADAAVRRIGADPERLAPDWIRLEVANALANKVLHEGLPPASASALLAAVQTYIGEQHDTLPLMDEAFMLALGLGHAVYDCLYLALAEREGAVLLTADRRFFERVTQRGFGARVKLLP